MTSLSPGLIELHDTSLITTLAFGFTAALFFGILAKRWGLSPIVGYLLAGIATGPHTPGFVGDSSLASQLAEIGVILLMFGVGLHFHLKDLLAVRSIALPGALGQSVLATLACMWIAHEVGWTWSEGAVLGIATAVASTVVLLRVLTDSNSLETPSGHVAVGWLIAEDIITVLVLVILPALALSSDGAAGEQARSSRSVWATAGLAVVKLLVLGGVVAVIGTRFVPWLLNRVARLRSAELFTLSILVMSIAVATASYLAFGASMALGAFLAGMLVGQSKFSHQAAADMLPLRDAFAVLFFVSIGMLFDYRAAPDHAVLTLGVLGVILIVKPLVAFLIVIAVGHSVRTALTVAGGLAQIGEFSFILAGVARSHGLMPEEGRAALIAGAILSISVNPFVFKLLLAAEKPLENSVFWRKWVAPRSASRRLGINADLGPAEPGRIQAIVVGYGPVGRTASELLLQSDIEPLIIEMNVETVSQLRSQGARALYGDATKREILKQAGLGSAGYLLITLPEPSTRLAVIATARELNPDVTIITRARYLTEQDSLRAAGASVVVCDEAGAAAGLARTLLERRGVPRDEIDRETRKIREDLSTAPPAADKVD